MNITLTGASGFIGGALVARLKSDGHELHILGRSAPRDTGVQFSKWDANANQMPPVKAIRDSDAVIHLAGEPVGQRWTPDVKRRIRESRVTGTRRLVDAIAAVESGHRPKTLISASAIGYYGNRGDEIINETSKAGKGFLPDVCVEWETAAQAAATNYGLRVVFLRTGIVLGQGGGALGQMLPFFRMGTGGRIGTGRQWMSWIHLDDMIGMALLALNNQAVSGPVNLTAPNPVTNSEFTQTLAEVIHRPAVLPIPVFGLRLLYGEMSQVLLEGQRVLPDAAARAKYQFRYPELRTALKSVT
jgi:uncharacterized protein (TIGR01777 family)